MSTTFRLIYSPVSSRFHAKTFDFTFPVPSTTNNTALPPPPPTSLAKRRNSSKAVPPQIATVGRNSACTFPFPEELHISMKHLTLEQLVDDDDDSLFVLLTDSSSNGTVVDGKRLEKGDTMRLEHGMEICLPSGGDPSNNNSHHKNDFTIRFEEVDGGATSSSEAQSSSPRTHAASMRIQEEWIVQVLQGKSENLALDVARLSTMVFSNGAKMKQILNELDKETKERVRLASLVKELISALRVAHDQLVQQGHEEFARQILDVKRWQDEEDSVAVEKQ